MTRKAAFPPSFAPDARLLILGSLPGDESLSHGQYYAHRTNAFWWLAGAVVGEPIETLPYAERLERLTVHIRDTIADAIAAGGSSLRDYRKADGSLGYFQHSFAAYDREGQPCRHEGCGGTIARIVQSGRSTFFCPVCQR